MTTQTSQKSTQLNTIEAAINDIRNGKIIIVVDDENRENEGDFLAAAEKVTPEMVYFMETRGRGLICARPARPSVYIYIFLYIYIYIYITSSRESLRSDI